MQATAIDLFCGAGGLSLGLQQAGFRILRAVDSDATAISTYSENLGDHALVSTLTPESQLPEADVIAGGPPCQGFSSAGQRKRGDVRNSLVAVFADFIVRQKPKAFIFENVEGFLTGEDGERVFDLLVPVIRAGYQVHLRKVNAANYGVPQHRKRVVAIGGLGWSPEFPDFTTSARGAPGAHLAARSLPSTPSVLEALADLPTPMAEPPGRPEGHWTAVLRDIDLERIRALRPGQRMRDLPPELWHESYRRRAYRRVMDGTPCERRGGAPAGIRRLVGEEPSKAITGAARNEFVHPTEDRFLTIRECARLQTFPDGFCFQGSQSAQAIQIGNAVPPLLARAVGSSLARTITAGQEAGTAQGKLLSFVPTLSSGMSPALQRTVELVRSEFGPAHQDPQLALCL